MSKLNIPASWAETTLGEIGTTMIGLTYSPNDISDKGIPVLRSGNVQKGKIDLNDLVKVKKEIRPNLFLNDGDILICARNGSKALVGKSAIISSLIEPTTFGAFMAVYRSKFNNYIQMYFQSSLFRSYLDGVGTSTINQITQNNLKGFSIPLPPLAEQNRIVQKIELTQSKIKVIEDNVTKAEALIEKYRESLLQKAFRGELVPQNPNDEPASELLKRIRSEKDKQADGKKKKKDELPPIKDDEIPFEIPKTWEWVRLGTITSKLTDGSHNPPKEVGSGRPMLSGRNIKDGRINFDKFRYISSADWLNENKRTNIKKNDVLLSIVGTIGESYVVGDIEPITVQRSVAVLGFSEDINPQFMSYYFYSPFIKNYFLNNAKGSAQKGIYLGALGTLLIPLPPLNEQTNIVNKIDTVIKAIKNIDAKLIDIANKQRILKDSILSSAFAGKLVPQIPSEGTGHDLLKEIQSKPTGDTMTTNKIKKSNAKKEKKK